MTSLPLTPLELRLLEPVDGLRKLQGARMYLSKRVDFTPDDRSAWLLINAVINELIWNEQFHSGQTIETLVSDVDRVMDQHEGYEDDLRGYPDPADSPRWA